MSGIEILLKFKNISGIQINAKTAFISFLIISKCYNQGLLNGKEGNIEDRHKMLSNNKEINELLMDLKFNEIIKNTDKDRLINIYKYMDRLITDKGYLAEYTLCNLIMHFFVLGIKEKEINIETANKFYNCKNQLGFFSFDQTEALLLLMSGAQKILVKNIIESYIYSHVKSIYILSYDKDVFNEVDYKDIGNTYTFLEEKFHKKIIYKDIPNKNFNYLHKLINEMEKNSFLLIIGIEKLTSINLDKAIINTHVKNTQFNIHTEDSINYDEFVKEMDKLFLSCSLKKSNMTAVFLVDDLYNFNVSKELESSASAFENFDILSLSCSTNEMINNLSKFLETLSTEEFTEVLNKNRKVIGEENYHLFLALKAFNNEDYLSSEQYLLKLYNKLTPENKLILANIYIYMKNYPRAFEILVDIYNEDRYLRSLMPAILETISNIGDDVQFDEWFKKALEVNDEDRIVIQYAANYYTKKSLYEKSSKEWRKLFDITKNEEYRLLADINLIIDKINNYDVDQIVSIISNYSQCYPEMKDEVNYRIGIILYEYKKKYQKSLEYLKKVDVDINEHFAYDAAKLRLKIYKDKILKINIEDKVISDSKLVLFVNELISDVHILTYIDASNYNWSRYIQDTLPYEKWKEILIKIILIKIQEWTEIDKDLFNKSKMPLDLNFINGIKTTIIDGKEVFEPKTIEQNLIMLFCNSISCMENGEAQKANDTIFTLFRLASTYQDNFYKDMSIILGLTAWSNSNYKIGDEVESMIALISAMDSGIKNKEVHFPFMVGLNNLFDFLYNNTKSFVIEEAVKNSLNKLFNNPYNELSKNKYYAIIKDYDKVIEKKIDIFKQIEKVWELKNDIQVIFNVKQEEEEYFADELKVLINAYYNKNDMDKACKYIYKYKDSLVINLYKRSDINYKLFYEWAVILADNNDYSLSKYFLELAIRSIEKLRSVFHKKERSFVGKEANKIYKKYIEIICKDNINKYKNDTVEVNDDLILKELLINMVPKSLIEQKQFNSQNFLSDDMIEMHKKYDNLFFIINNMTKKGIYDDTYHRKLNEFLECKKQLEENHPYFKSLPDYNNLESNTSLNIYQELRNRLCIEELFYQIVLIDNYIIHNFIDKDEESIVIEKIDYEQYTNMLEFLKENIIKEDYFLENKVGLENFIKISDEISGNYIKPLFKYIDKNKYKKLYFMPELNLTYFNMNYMRYKNKWLVDFFDSIENVIDFNVVGKKLSNNYSSKYLAHFLNKQDKKISPILKMIKSKNYIEIIDNNHYIQINEPIKIFVLIGHGVSDVSGFNYLGARSISKSRKENVSLQKYLNIKSWVENTLIISCSSGTLINDYSERNNGVWSSLFEKKTAYILYCKWDVSIKFTNIILGKVLEIMKNSNKLLSEALIEAQREMSSFNPILWAGLEVWKNE